MHREFALLAVGDPNLDRVFAVSSVPRSGQKIVGHLLGIFGGGTTANVACAVGRLGVPAAAIGRVGDDEDGALLTEAFRADGVSTAYLRVVPGIRSATALIMVERSGEKALVYAPIASQPMEPSLLEEAIARSSVVYLTPHELETLASVSRLGRRHGTCVAADLEALAAHNMVDLRSWLQLADLVFMNEAAFRSTTGEHPTEAAISRLLEWGPTAVVVTLGAGGATAACTGESIHQPAFAADVVDTTGAGDGFAAAFIVASLRGDSLAHCTRFACAAASLAVTRVGAREGFPTASAIREVLARAAPH